MSSPLGDMPIQVFLDDFWQKKPCLIRQAIPDFFPELDRNDVAGLACDEMAEARLVSGTFEGNDWKQEYGPFKPAKLRKLPERNWTLLVQDVEKHYPPLQALLAQFHFIPGWRLDDLMISIAAPGGSVGPHVDQYDVFLLQAEGRRRWQVASEYEDKLLENCDLSVLAAFEPELEWDLSPGDMLYLPPGVAHHGVALDDCMTWSIGLRAPSQADLLQGMGEWLAENRNEGSRYRDRPADALPRPGEISPPDVQGLQELMHHAIDAGDETNAFLANFISRYRLAHQPAPPEHAIDADELSRQLSAGSRLLRNPWTRLVWVEWDGKARLFAAGEEFLCSIKAAEALNSMPPILPDKSVENLELITALINSGHFYLQSPGPAWPAVAQD